MLHVCHSSVSHHWLPSIINQESPLCLTKSQWAASITEPALPTHEYPPNETISYSSTGLNISGKKRSSTATGMILRSTQFRNFKEKNTCTHGSLCCFLSFCMCANIVDKGALAHCNPFTLIPFPQRYKKRKQRKEIIAAFTSSKHHTWKNHSNVLPQAAFISIKITYHSLVPINPRTQAIPSLYELEHFALKTVRSSLGLPLLPLTLC